MIVGLRASAREKDLVGSGADPMRNSVATLLEHCSRFTAK
jgi:hypothetical protein